MNLFLRNTVCYCTAILAMMSLLPHVTNAEAPTPFGAVPNDRQVEWYHREAQVFLHFGMNTFTGAEWGDGKENPTQFNPTMLDCGQWAKVMKSGCFTGAILVVKAHDGFCLWPSDYTTHDVASSTNWRGGKGDVVRDFVDSCRVYGIKPGIYMSIGDFHSEKLGNYATYYLNQEREILQKYGKIWEIWWESGSSSSLGSTTMKRYADSVHLWAPDCVIWSDASAKNVTADIRWIGNEKGNSGDPCWATEDMTFSNHGNGVRGGSLYVPAEVSSSDRPCFFWHENENDSVNSIDDMWNKYFNSVGHNCTWLYNIPPDNRGLIYSTDSIRVDSLGGWIYGTFKAPQANLAEGATVTTLHPRGAGYEPANLVDKAEATYYATPDNVNTDTITVDLGSAKTFDCLMLREVIQLGHRTTGWSVDFSTDNSLYTALVSNKQSIGYKWLEKFNLVSARYLRIRITKGQACIALNTFGVYKKTFVRPGIVRTADPAVLREAPQSFVTIPVFGRSLELPSSFARKPFTAELLDLSGRTVAEMRVDTNLTPKGSSTLSKAVHSGLYLVRCSGESGVAVRKFMKK